MKTHDGAEHIGKMYGTPRSTRKTYHRAQRRAAARQISEELGEYTGIYQTQDEAQARRVLTLSGTLRFMFKDGWYSIVIPGLIDPEESSKLNAQARAIAHTDLKPQGLQAFKEFDR